MQINIHSKIEQIPAKDWNALVKDNNPFLRHEFLAALENHGCVSDAFGWRPCHISIQQDGELIGAMPLYSKTNSYGEFVFDHAWADAYQRNQIAYFPKLVSSIPYTPASGQRLLCRDENQELVFPLLIKTVQQFAQQQNYSSFHCLFPLSNEQDWMEAQHNEFNLLTRQDCQFHWHNQSYSDFDAFLAKLDKRNEKISAKKEKGSHNKISNCANSMVTRLAIKIGRTSRVSINKRLPKNMVMRPSMKDSFKRWRRIYLIKYYSF